MTSDNRTPRFNTLTDRVRYYTRDVTGTLGRKLHEIGVHPDAITALGLVIVAIASYVASQGHFFWAAIILLLGTPLDALDGAVARAMQRTGKFGALFDSTLDRYADGFIFMGLAYHFSLWGNERVMLLSMAALLGSLLVSYVRARAEGLNVDCKVGVLTRMERVVIIIAMLLTGWVEAGLWILAIGTHVTVIQRVWYVYRTLKREESAL
ncbi:MAG: CDP-alcohol phosphatidyltransferase family protein [Chloroflexi bacterium]|jgi:CDP-diacylglycerol--glycerol-3-phosphate 3-phosphatidyltransferase|nr:CDP-alcohol phosphatidyltransferase family protein [Chloroflexota bacterium]